MSRVRSHEHPSPLTDSVVDTLARIARLGQGYHLTIGAGDGEWIPAEGLVHGGPLFERVIDRLGAWRGQPAVRRAIGSQFVLLYLRFVWPAVAAFALERRVPDIGAANLLVRLDDAGWPAAFSLASPRFAVLEGDPASDEASLLARNEAELLHWLHARSIDANAAPLVDTVTKRLLTSGSALWGNVAAAFAHPLLWHVQHVAPESAAVVRDAEALLSSRDSTKLGDQVRLLRVIQGDDQWTVHARRTCCLRWCLPGEERCDDCPLVREPQAGEFLRARLTDAIARGEALRAEIGLTESEADRRRGPRSA
jgi:ferric iron reductase protein FhuF